MYNETFYQIIGEYSIHTIGMYHNLTYEDYRNIFDIIKSFSQYHENDELPQFLNTYENNSFPSVSTIPGLKFRLSNTDTGIFGVNIEINPVTLFMYNKGVTDHFDNLQISPISDQFWKEFIIALSAELDNLGLGYLDNWFLTRVDLCVNIAIDKSFDLQKYIYYLKKTVRKYNNRLDGFKDENIDPFSFKLFTNNTALVVYDKTHQLELDSDLNVMRIELQIRKRKIKNTLLDLDPSLYYRYDYIPPLLDKLIILSQNAKEIMIDNIRRIMPIGDYYNEDSINYILDMRGFISKKVRDDLWDLLNDLSNTEIDSPNINRLKNDKSQKFVKNTYIKSHSRNTYYKRMSILKRLGIAPVYIPNEDGTVYMPGLYTILHDLAE